MPTDCFQALGVVRRPWLEAESLQTQFQALSAEAHPDRLGPVSADIQAEGAARFQEINAAYQVLKDPVSRLRHFLELEQGEGMDVVERTPATLMEVFLDVGGLLQSLDRYLKAAQAQEAPLAKIARAQRVFEEVERAHGLRAALEARVDAVEARVRRWDHEFEFQGFQGGGFDALREDYKEWRYLARWLDQIHERVFAANGLLQ